MTLESPTVDVNAPVRHRRIGELLVSKGVVSEDQVRIALTEQKRTKEHLGRILVRLGFATESVIRDVLGGALGYDSVDLSKVVVDSDIVSLIPKDVARRYHMVALTRNSAEKTLTVAMADPYNVIALDQVRALLGGDVEVRALIAGQADLNKAIDQFYGFELSVDGILQEIETGEIDYASLEAESDEYSQPVVRLVNALLSDAVKRGASDIHFEPEHDFLRIRYRIDGVLRQIRSLHRNYWSAIAVRVKVMANMNIAEMRAPQDGRISLSVSGRPIDFRVSSLPTTYGENIVLRVLDRQKGIVNLEALGLEDNNLTTLRLMMARPEGLILVTGPTGSGKTTTLYSMLSHLNTEQVNIMTLEDPVEYPLEMIRQTSVNEAIRLDFASGIRSMMRQDPDIILVGEIRDEDTAVMAIQSGDDRPSGLLHAAHQLGGRRGAEAAGQRHSNRTSWPAISSVWSPSGWCEDFVRKLQAIVSAESPWKRQILRIPDGSARCRAIFRSQGCRRCDFTGFRGRMALMEVLRFDSEIDELVARRATTHEILKHARSNAGFSSLRGGRNSSGVGGHYQHGRDLANDRSDRRC